MLQFNFTPFPVLASPRLLLRSLETADVAEIFFLRSDGEVLRYIGKEPAKTEGEALDFIRKIQAAIANNESMYWAICLKEEPGKLIGTICLWNMDPLNHRAEIGFALHPGYWRKGLMKEAILAVLDYGFETLRLHSIEARLDPANTASAGVLEATGFIKEGHLRESFYFRERFIDSLIYSRFPAKPMNTADYFIREALQQDIPQIQFVRNSVTENRLSDPALVPDADVEDYLFNRGKGWVCCAGDRVIGFSIVSLQDQNVWALFVQPGFEKKGIGRLLQQRMLDWYFSQTEELLWLSTAPGTRAESFYRVSGWQEAGTYGKGETRFEMTAAFWKGKNAGQAAPAR